MNQTFGHVELSAAVSEVAHIERTWRRLIGRPGYDRMHTAPRTACQNTGQRSSGFFGKAVRESGHDNEVIRFGHFSCGGVVLFNGVKFTAEIRLENALHMFRDFLELVANLSRFCPDAIVNQQLIKVCQMH